MNSMEQIWKVRDSRGLDTYEKNFLMTIASRGEAGMFCEWKRNSDDMGMKKDRYYKTRTSLTDKGLISAQEQAYGPTIYKINDAELIEWCTTHSVTQNGDSVTQNAHSATQNGHSVSPERKKNIKINKKKNKEEELDESAGASSFPIDKNKSNKDEEDNEGASRPTAPATPIGPKEEVGLMVEENPGHSVTQNEVDDEDNYYEWNGRKVRKAGAGTDWDKVVVTPPIPKVPCSHCNEDLDKNGLCWNMACAA
jgi:hypothetical protein